VLLSQGNENSKIYHNYVKARKISNTILDIQNGHGKSVSKFQDIAIVGVSHFQNLFKDPVRVNITKIVRFSSHFPRLVDGD